MNIRKLIAARLGPLSMPLVRFGFGGGTGRDPDRLTNEDIDGAIGLARQVEPLAVDVLCLVWWPEWRAHGENCRRVLADLRQHLRPKLPLVERIADQTLVARAQQPGVLEALQERVIGAVVAELMVPEHCANCEGYGKVADLSKLRETGKITTEVCGECFGAGDLRYSDNRRARILGVRRASYPLIWREAFEAMHREVNALQSLGGRTVDAKLFGEDPVRWQAPVRAATPKDDDRIEAWHAFHAKLAWAMFPVSDEGDGT